MSFDVMTMILFLLDKNCHYSHVDVSMYMDTDSDDGKYRIIKWYMKSHDKTTQKWPREDFPNDYCISVLKLTCLKTFGMDIVSVILYSFSNFLRKDATNFSIFESWSSLILFCWQIWLCKKSRDLHYKSVWKSIF